MYMRVVLWSSQPYQMFHIESAFEFYKSITLHIYIYLYLQILLLYSWQIILKSFCHVNKQCLLLHEKIGRSKAHDKKRKFTQYITKNIVASNDTLLIRRMENVSGNEAINVVTTWMTIVGRQDNNKLLTKRSHISFFLSWLNSSFRLLGSTNVKPNQIA